MGGPPDRGRMVDGNIFLMKCQKELHVKKKWLSGTHSVNDFGPEK